MISNSFMLIFIYYFGTPKTTYKASQLFEKGVASRNFTFNVWNTCKWFWQNCCLSFFSVTFVNIGEVISSSYCVSTQKKPKKIITGFLNWCGIIWSCLHPLEYILRFPTKLPFKLRFQTFQIFFRLSPF